MELGGPQSRVLILQWNSKTPAREQVQNITLFATIPNCLILTVSEVSHILRCLICHMCVSGLHKQPWNRSRNCEFPYINKISQHWGHIAEHFSVQAFCGFSPVPHTRQMMELCKTQKSFLACYKIAEVSVAIALCLILLHPNNKRTYCTK